MQSIRDRRSRILSFVYRGLKVCVVFLVLVFIGGTIYGIFFQTALQENKTTEDFRGDGQGQQGQTFTGIGRIRVSTAGPEPGMVIIFVSFFYHPEDKAFSEELAFRVREFRAIITDYIGSFSAAELQEKGEEDIKAELLRRFNATLRLGQIETLFFSDFMVVG